MYVETLPTVCLQLEESIHSNGCPEFLIAYDCDVKTSVVEDLVYGVNIQHKCDILDDEVRCRVIRQSPTQERRDAVFKLDFVEHCHDINHYILNIYCTTTIRAVDYMIEKGALSASWLATSSLVPEAEFRQTVEQFYSDAQKSNGRQNEEEQIDNDIDEELLVE